MCHTLVIHASRRDTVIFYTEFCTWPSTQKYRCFCKKINLVAMVHSLNTFNMWVSWLLMGFQSQFLSSCQMWKAGVWSLLWLLCFPCCSSCWSLLFSSLITVRHRLSTMYTVINVLLQSLCVLKIAYTHTHTNTQNSSVSPCLPVSSTCLHGMQCGDGNCVWESQWCDGVMDCPAGQDEAHCGKQPHPHPGNKCKTKHTCNLFYSFYS